MEKIVEDAANIRKLLPWIESEDDIVNFIRSIPIDNNHLRYQLTLLHFIKERDAREVAGFEQKIEDDAREIVIMLPETSYRDIKERLTALGGIPNRKEVVIRQILHQRFDLDPIVKELDRNRKRKSENVIDVKDVDTNIKIKIRKSEGSLKVVSSITQEKSPINNQHKFHKIVTHVDDNSSSSSSSSDTTKLVEPVKQELPETEEIKFDLVDYLYDVTRVSYARILSACRYFGIPWDAKPSDADLNRLLNKLMSSDVIEINDSPSDDDEYHIIKEEINEEPEETANTANINWVMRPSMLFNNDNATITNSNATKRNYIKPAHFDSLDLRVVHSEDRNTFVSVIQSTVSAKPSQPTVAANPFQPAVVAKPFQPAVAANPYQLVVAANPSPPSVAAKPSQSAIATNPYQTAVAANPYQPAVAAKPFQPAVTANPSQLAVAANPSHPAVAANPSQPAVAANPSHPAVAANPFQPAVAAKPSQPAVAAKPYQSTVVENQSHLVAQPNDITSQLMEDIQNQDDNQPSSSSAINEPSEILDAVEGGEELVDSKLLFRIMEIFPQVCPKYIRTICAGKTCAELDDVVTVILSNENCPKRPERPQSPPKEVNIDEQVEIVKELLPDADPNYLRLKCQEYGNNIEGLSQFINEAREKKDYPTMKDYLRKKQLSAQSKQYTTEFDVEKFVQLFPDPSKTFTDPKRVVKIDPYTKMYLCTYFQNRYDKLPIRTIKSILQMNSYKILASDIDMSTSKCAMKGRRKPVTLSDPVEDILILQELAYVTHKEEIEKLINEKMELEKHRFKFEKDNGMLSTCQCCYDEEVMMTNIVECPNGCKACKECIIRSCEVAFGEGKIDFPCLNDCKLEYRIHTLQNVLPPKMFSKIAQKKALAEVKAAGIEELEMCPFCDFASIPNENDRIFRCLNPDCMKESCRLCKEPNHVPLRCDEVEKDEAVKARVFIENRMTEALLRKCWKCGTSFYKEEGCNMMTCTCRAQMCYLCQEPVTDYSHFNGLGGDKFDRCPLYSDTNQINKKNVLEAAASAKAEVDPSKLRVDPTEDVALHFDKRAKILPKEPHLDIINQQMDVRNVPAHHRHVYYPQLRAMIPGNILDNQHIMARLVQMGNMRGHRENLEARRQRRDLQRYRNFLRMQEEREPGGPRNPPPYQPGRH